MWGVKIEQTEDGRHYVAGLGLSMEDTEEGKLSQFLVAANRIAFIDPANGNETPMFVAQGNQIFMNEVFLKYLTAPTITSGGNPPVFSLTPDGRLTAKNADISGNVNANSGRSIMSRLTRTVGFWENCPRTRLKAISLKQWAKLSPGLPCTGAVAIRDYYRQGL